ncbi:RNA polymerase sigma factor [Streptomyces sp. 8K308]|uniref:RNA polymerase sigma factor n=1 Tax=Streptomyces sp. 8K308 TaxID=2530388 RepID=UPI00104E4322|nr:RNA polymerase sigma factor [Streptomyces sp. 8K308]TDC21376.1 RNA polymerase sigma factor [Streptomyces sp. 8K308]
MDPDDELLARAARKSSAFEPLVARHTAALHGYLVRRAPAVADDLLADVWLQAYANRHTYDVGRRPARGWLFGVARNVLARHWQRAAREAGAAQPPGDAMSTDSWEAVDQRLVAAAAGPELRSRLAGLSAELRELILLVAWEELTPTEAAAVVGIPVGTARSRLHRARAQLREGLSGGILTTLTGDFA